MGQTEPLPPLAEGGVANFTIVRSDLATSEQARPAVLVREALESVTGAKFAIKTDWEKPMPSQQELSSRYEILVGDTNRAESKQAKEKLVGDDEFIIETIGHKLVIAANSERALKSAAEHFCLYIGYDPSGEMKEVSTLSIERGYSYKGVYEMVVTPQTPDSRPCIVDTLYPSGDIVVADKIFTAITAPTAPAQRTSRHCCKALGDLASAGGGTRLPAENAASQSLSQFRICDTARRYWRTVCRRRYAPLLLRTYPRSTIHAGAVCYQGARRIRATVWYPQQDISDVKPYPYTFYIDGQGDGYMLQTIMNVTVLNGYRGIGACVVEENAHEMMTIESVYGTFLYCAATAYNQADVGTWKNFFISPEYWANATPAYNAPL